LGRRRAARHRARVSCGAGGCCARPDPPQRGALVVVTLKVVRGHSLASCLAQVARQTERLGEMLEPGFQVLRLPAA